jgi:drug/metabolite transporter (DMT)-like permease
MDRRLRGFALVAAAAVLWGLWVVFLRPAGLPGFTSGAILFAVLVVAGIPSAWRHRHKRRSPQAWAWMAFAGLLDAGNAGCYFTALDRGSIATAVLSHYLAPALAPLFAWLFLRERLSVRTLPATLLGLAGLAALLRPGANGPPVLSAALWGGASAVCYGALFPVGKRLMREFDAYEVQGYHSVVAALALAFVSPPFAAINAPLRSYLIVFGGAILCALIAGQLFYRGLALAPAGQASTLTYVEPLVATFAGAVLFHEPIGWPAALGAALVISGGLILVLEPSSSPSQTR